MHPNQKSLYAQFLEFHGANPDVYKSLVRMSHDLVCRGHKRYGIGGLFEVLRWQSAMLTDSKDWKLNNNYRAFYARLIMASEPLLDGFFELREQKAAAPGTMEA